MTKDISSIFQVIFKNLNFPSKSSENASLYYFNKDLTIQIKGKIKASTL